MQHCNIISVPVSFQTELQHLFTAISESKFQVIQKMAGVLDHTTTKQLEVRFFLLLLINVLD